MEPISNAAHTLCLAASISEPANTSFVALGGFLFPSTALTLTAVLRADDISISKGFQLLEAWNRFGVIVEAPTATEITVMLTWPGSAALNIWGLAAGAVALPDGVAALGPSVTELQQSHLAPETFYLVHDGALGLDINEDQSGEVLLVPGAPISLKKCAYCGRLLPVDMDRLGCLSFHKHLAKKTNHQNECRACKKWRINDDFNPKRTTDQLHESSLITRERKFFLREPSIIQAIKERTGAGLKSQVWERFGRACFYCRKPIELEEFQLDHTRPLAYLWPIDEHATCLCAEHNNFKREKFPVDVYSDKQLRELSAICGLTYDDLRAKKLNEVELARILRDLPLFAQEWDPRTFEATARKITELRPDLNLHSLLEEADPALSSDVMRRLKERPASIEQSDE